jgi:hypothetical protein
MAIIAQGGVLLSISKTHTNVTTSAKYPRKLLRGSCAIGCDIRTRRMPGMSLASPSEREFHDLTVRAASKNMLETRLIEMNRGEIIVRATKSGLLETPSRNPAKKYAR